MDQLREGQVSLEVHGPTLRAGDHGPLSGSFFAQKLHTLVMALRAADEARNGGVRHDYRIADLRTDREISRQADLVTSASVVLAEEPLPRLGAFPGESGIKSFDECVSAIHDGEFDRARQFGRCPAVIAKLAAGSAKRFSYGELRVNGHNLFRVDNFLADLAKAVNKERSDERRSQSRWFKGVVHSTFDGNVQAVDLRGSLPQITLILTAGHKELECICQSDDIDQIRKVLDRRVRISGQAYYDGKSGLPRRIEVTLIEPIKVNVDFTRWEGAFKPFVAPEWVGDA